MSTKSKGDILESITEILERSLSSKSTVITKNKKIEDLDGLVREVDIYIETIANKRKFNIVIECKNYKEGSRIEIDKISAFYDKCQRLPSIHKMIFLTTSDYQSGAIIKAKSRNIDLYRITKESINSDNQLGIDNISIIEKKCKILGIRFNSDKLRQDKIFTNKKLEFYNKNKESLKHDDLNQILLDLPEIWSFLFTRSGLLLNYKKIIYPNVKAENIYTNYNGEYYPVESIQFTLEIEYSYKPLKLNNIKKYQSLSEETTLAIFSDLEFIAKGIKHQFCYVKPTDENEGKFFISSPDIEKPIELKTLASFKEGPKPISKAKSKIRNIQVLPYEYKMADQAFKNSTSNCQDVPETKTTNLRKELKSRKSSIYLGLDEQEKKLFFMIPFSRDNKIITAKFPEPISLYFNHSVELYTKSLSYRDTMVSNSPKDEGLLMQDDSYHKFLQYSISSILMLHSAIELFINSNIKDNFEIELDGRRLNKKEIEEELTLSQKIEKIIPLISTFKLNSNKRIINSLINLNELNEELQNLKTSGSIGQQFLETFEKLIQFKMDYCFESTKKLFKKVNKHYILNEFEN
ncbi:restriction endonuclease [Ancylomarina sp. YFZ004]